MPDLCDICEFRFATIVQELKHPCDDVCGCTGRRGHLMRRYFCLICARAKGYPG